VSGRRIVPALVVVMRAGVSRVGPVRVVRLRRALGRVVEVVERQQIVLAVIDPELVLVVGAV
jgi:hypothetical protein